MSVIRVKVLRTAYMIPTENISVLAQRELRGTSVVFDPRSKYNLDLLLHSRLTMIEENTA